MKFDKFIATFFMLNVVLGIAVVFSIKNRPVMETTAEIIYGRKVSAEYFDLPPEQLENFQKDSPGAVMDGMTEIFAETDITPESMEEISLLPPYERAAAIVKKFSLMGDGECLEGASLAEKINAAKQKKGCSYDFAQIFTALASYTGLESRIVSNGTHFGAEIYDGGWIFIDPYFAMSVSSENGYLSYADFSRRMLSDGWMRFDCFGGEDHCMTGKPIESHPYFGDRDKFAALITYSGSNTFETVKAEAAVKEKLMHTRVLAPYRNGRPEIIHAELVPSGNGIVRKYVMTGMGVIGLLFIAADIILPLYFLTGLILRRTRKKPA